MNLNQLRVKFLLLFVPYSVAELMASMPTVSYLVAWLGSFFIFYVSIFGKISPLPKDLPLTKQVMRPLVLTQLIFAGYMCTTSIFYFMHLNGFYYLTYDPLNEAPLDEILLAAQCQRYYSLGHGCYVMGLLFFMEYKLPRWKVETKLNVSDLLFRICIASSILSWILWLVPGMSQVMIVFMGMNVVSSVLMLAMSLVEKNHKLVGIALSIFLFNVGRSLLSGWKEEMMILILLLGFLCYPYYKKTVTIMFPLAILAWFVFIPTFNRLFREMNWLGNTEASAAAASALSNLQEIDGEAIRQTNWLFFTERLSEISMFVKYSMQVPGNRGYYGTELVEQAISVLVPRIVWSDKPITETVVMKRVYELGIINELSSVSAKPPYIVDAYLSYGALGIAIACFALGAMASLASRKAEDWFGGYILGSALMYNSFFQILWRANSFEFLLNSYFWSFILMYFFFKVAQWTGFVVRNRVSRPVDPGTVHGTPALSNPVVS